MKVVNDTIPFEVYTELRVKCGLSAKSLQAAKTGLSNSLHCVMLVHNDQVIGMGRIIGDGGCFCQVVDICVDPNYQGKGLGRLIMANLTDFINNHLPDSCYVSLIADGDASYLYEKFGFKDTMPASKGMFLKVEKAK
ncbi:GNAT family N-acetyltransferase [Flavobacterium rakeshii]|uniref:GNAT family N-acetyltransferase n=1 Tax=Flavobacterium rakeshii TaxID=1038845 RepID=A0A6N8HAU7_9FLAO|nr:GNAT family N-acetyltransferase [Flavobacterium rakeshii]